MILARTMTLAAAMLVLGSYAATAQTTGGAQQNSERATQMRAAAQACKPDIEKFCASVQPGGGRIAACLREHNNELSDGCRKAAASSRSSQPAK